MSRPWVKLWVGEWLDGTTRYEMTGAQRAFWIDLLAMAGRSRQPGIICAGQSGGRIIGYPLGVFQGLDAGSELDILATLKLFEACGKIRMEVTQETPMKLMKIEIMNWSKYQSEYQRQKGHRQRYKESDKEGGRKVTTKNTKRLPVEGEGDGEGEGEAEKDKSISSATSAEQSVSVSEAVIHLPLNDGREYQVKKNEVREWMRLYPAVDVLQELRNIRGWLLANPRKRKTRTGIHKFINGWLAKEQDRGPHMAPQPTPIPQRQEVPVLGVEP